VAVAAALVLALVGVGLVPAQPPEPTVKPGSEAESPAKDPEQTPQQVEADAHEIFAAIADAWSAEDHEALADLVAADGVQIAIAPQRGRENHYSPNQAFYFFKNLFQSASTDSFRFRRLQDEKPGGLVHGLADWLFRKTGTKTPTSERLIFSLSHTSTGWGLAEVRAIR
jgi:hypothetical protein